MSDAGLSAGEIRAPYMYWAKTRPVTEFDLAASNMLALSIDELEGAHDALQLTAANDEGYGPLLASIAAHYGVTPDRVMTSIGCSGANFLVVAAHVKAGDAVLMERPGYDPLAGASRLMGATVHHFERRAEEGFAVKADAIRAALTPATKLVIVTSPHNPSGATLDRATLEALDRLSAETGVQILVDEAYLDIARLLRSDPEWLPRAATLSPRLISTSSLTKSYGLNGLRCGWAVVPPGMSHRLRRTRDVIDGVGSAPADRLATLAFTQLSRLGQRAVRHVSTNLEIVRRFLTAHPELELPVPLEASILFPRLRGVADTDAFARMAAERFGVTVVPGRFFGAPAHLRLSVAGPTAQLAGGLERLGAALAAR
ncbi:MAG: pyridoxal phosphate-dependent aminotransferase [Acidobacteria bacterium]|nr:MAG: pyridoxal phosphate-dependent aminotransferase [Acidobacteriota bacterium]